jgi:hypothetical protein
MKAIGESKPRSDTTLRRGKAARANSTRFARVFLVLAVVAGVLILIDLGGVVTTLAKGLFFVFTILSLYFVASSEPSH